MLFACCFYFTTYLNLCLMNDLFETPELLPNNVQEILNKFSEMDNTYEECEELVSELNQVGYTCDYYLDAVPYDLRKI